MKNKGGHDQRITLGRSPPGKRTGLFGTILPVVSGPFCVWLPPLPAYQPYRRCHTRAFHGALDEAGAFADGYSGKALLVFDLEAKNRGSVAAGKIQLSDTAFLHHEELKALPYEAEHILAEHAEQMAVLLGRLLESLTARQREVLYLRFYEGLSYEEIAEVSEVKVGRVYNIVYEALSQMRKLANNHGFGLVIFLSLKINDLLSN